MFVALSELSKLRLPLAVCAPALSSYESNTNSVARSSQPVSLVPLLGNLTKTLILPLFSAVAAGTIVVPEPLVEGGLESSQNR